MDPKDPLDPFSELKKLGIEGKDILLIWMDGWMDSPDNVHICP